MNQSSRSATSNHILPHVQSFDDLTKDQLVEVCNSLTSELEVSQAKLESQRNASREFMNGVSHDLHAPWRAISGFANYLQCDYQQQLDDTANGYIDQISLGVERMKRQFRGLMKIAEVSIAKTKSEVVDLNKSVEDAIFTLIQEIEDHNATITCDPLPHIVGDNNQIRILFENLISNSIRFCAERDPRIHVSAKQDLQKTIVSVSDNGNGMKAREYERAFEVFRCCDVENEAKGQGVGLTLCRRIAEQHNSSIWIESEFGVGTVVNFSLPQRAIHSANANSGESKLATNAFRPNIRSHAKYRSQATIS